MLPVNMIGDAAAAEAMVNQAVRSPRTVPFEAERDFDNELQHRMDESWLLVTPLLAGESDQRIDESDAKKFSLPHRHSSPERKRSEHEHSYRPAIANHIDRRIEHVEEKIINPIMGHILDITF